MHRTAVVNQIRGLLLEGGWHHSAEETGAMWMQRCPDSWKIEYAALSLHRQYFHCFRDRTEAKVPKP
jgi:hypothetical protein